MTRCFENTHKADGKGKAVKHRVYYFQIQSFYKTLIKLKHGLILGGFKEVSLYIS